MGNFIIGIQCGENHRNIYGRTGNNDVREKTFTLVVTRDYCKYCAEFFELMNKYLKNHHVEIYNVNLDGITGVCNQIKI